MNSLPRSSNSTVKCTYCDETDPNQFYYSPRGKRNSSCYQCRREYNREYRRRYVYINTKPVIAYDDGSNSLLRKYGLTIAAYQEMLDCQNGACLICNETPVLGRSLVIDHCHQTGKVRGLLCNKCNLALGLMQDNPELLRKSAEYLER